MAIIRKTIVILFLAGFVAWLLFFCWVHISYSSDLPQAPDEKTGHIYRMVVNHGFVCYGTEQELRILKWAENTQIIAGAFLLMAFILGVRFDVFKKKAVEGNKGGLGYRKFTTSDSHKEGRSDTSEP